MKRTRIVCLILAVILLVACSACNRTPNDPWSSATYKEDAEFGTGSKTVLVDVQVEDKAVTFKINTDKETLGEALLEHGLISGEEGAYGLYVKVVNGITADYNSNQRYWSLTKNGEYMQTGVDGTVIADGEQYALVYTE
ncbi:MAG: DUF4430 domain-containing protein [Ruminococcaceae bacterium]|nr:DUF4430 domain-containing protein [Oscillospiraceae bacterium]